MHSVAISFGFFSISWYALCFVFGAVGAFLFLRNILLHSNNVHQKFSQEECWDLFLFLFVGAIVGARLGYVIFYNASFFLSHPIQIVSPFDVQAGAWVGISGMSYHGGVIGVLLAVWIFSRRYQKSLLPLLDVIALSAPLAIFFGRIGNFITGELFGRVTTVPWGMVFARSGDDALRHPSQLYEAFGEGILLFVALLWFSKQQRTRGMLVVWYVGLYGAIRFFLEFFREPDSHIGFFFKVLTLGQIFSTDATYSS